MGVQTRQASDEAKVIKASMELQQKVGTGSIEEYKIDRAQVVINENKVDFGPIAKPHMDELRNLLNDLAQSRGDKSDREVLRALMTPTMNIKANAATFNYRLRKDYRQRGNRSR